MGTSLAFPFVQPAITTEYPDQTSTMQSSQFLDGPVMANLSLVNLLDHRVTHRGGVGGGGPGGVPGKNASVGVVGGGPSGVLGDIGGVAGNGHTKNITSPDPHRAGGVTGAIWPMSTGMSYMRRWRG